MAYTTEILSIICPKCRASIGGRCLDKTLWGQKYIEYPHPERIAKSSMEKE